jgi:hypothetical protein
MTTAPDNHDHDALDRQARQLHATALAHVSAPTLARLREARRGGSSARRLPAWLAGGAVAAAVVLAVALQPGLSPLPAPVVPVVATTATLPAATAPDPAEPLQEDPGFYVWLDSADATALAME